jgi:predicted dehydrogenase
MASLRAGIIGGGWIARRHVPAIDVSDGVELVAACDADLARATAIAEPRGARAFARWEEMLEQADLDVVWVCTPPLAHRKPTVQALSRGIHVYLEKPIARTLPDAEEIVAAAERAQAICMVGYQWHASELLDEVREATRGQPIGLLTGRNYGPVVGRPWFINQSQGGGQILERGSHHIDFQRAVAGEVTAVEATSGPARLTTSDDSARDIDDVLSLLFHFRSGALGTVNLAWTADGQPGVYSLDVLAADASLWLDFGGDTVALRGQAAGRALRAEYRDPFHRSVARFLEVAHSGDRSRIFCPPADALRTLAVALACELALESGARVEVD